MRKEHMRYRTRTNESSKAQRLGLYDLSTYLRRNLSVLQQLNVPVVIFKSTLECIVVQCSSRTGVIGTSFFPANGGLTLLTAHGLILHCSRRRPTIRIARHVQRIQQSPKSIPKFNLNGKPTGQ